MATIAKAATGVDLSLGSSWTGGVVPTSVDVANWIPTSLGGTQTGNVIVNNTAGKLQFDGALSNLNLTGTVSIGTGGLSIAAGGVDVTLATVTMIGSQTWSVGLGRTLALTGTVTLPTASALWAVTGGGLTTLAAATSLTNSAQLQILSGTFRVLSGGSISIATQGLAAIGTATQVATDVAVLDIRSGTNTFSRTTSNVSMEIGRDIGYGAMRLTGGSVTFATEAAVGTNGIATSRNAGFYMTGGTLTHTASGLVVLRNYSANAATNVGAMATLTGGTSSMNYGGVSGANMSAAGTLALGSMYIGGNHAMTITGTADNFFVGDSTAGVVTIDSNASVTFNNTSGYAMVRRFGAPSATTTGIFNIKGSFSASGISRGTSGTAGVAYLNFDGGTWNTTSTTSVTAINTFGQNAADAITIWSGGLNIKNVNRNLVYYTLDSAFKKPTGSGVNTITFANGGQGYVAPPLVEISGGGGRGASAAALIDANGTVTSITITSRGQDYTSAPTITLRGQTGSAAGFPSFVAATGVTATISANPTKAGPITIKSNGGAGGGRMWFGAGGVNSIYPTNIETTFDGDIVMEGDSGEFGSQSAMSGSSTTNNCYQLLSVLNVTVNSFSSVTNDSQFYMGMGGGDYLASGSFVFPITVPHVFAGTGGVVVGYNRVALANIAGPVVFNPGALIGLTGTAAPSAGISGTGSLYRTRVGSGLWLSNTSYSASGRAYGQIKVEVSDLPAQIGFYQISVPESPTLKVFYSGLNGGDYSSTILGTWSEVVNPAEVYFEHSFNDQSVSIGRVKRYDTKTGTQSVLFCGTPNTNGLNSISVAFFDGNVSPVAKFGNLVIREGAVGVSSIATVDAFGVLVPQHPSALSGFAGIYLANLGATLDVSGNLALSNSSSILYLSNTVRSQSGVNSAAFATISMQSGSTILVSEGATLTLSTISGSISDGGSVYNLAKTGGGTLVNNTLTTSTTYSGATSIAGTFSASILANGTVDSHIGRSSASASNLRFGNGGVAGTLLYTGTGASVNRNFRIDDVGGTISNSGTGVLTWLGSPSFLTADTAYNFGLGGPSTLANTFNGVVSNNGTGATSFTKSGTGTWVLRPLSGSTPVNNTHSGANVIAGGKVVCATEADVATAGTGRVLGTGATTVQNGATIQTSTGAVQFGRMRYGGNLTFEAGSTLIIGG